MGRHRLIAAAGAALLLALAGCGATPPQAPGPEAHRLNTALSAISTACGNAAEIQAFTKDARAMAMAGRQAEQQVPVLAQIYGRNPNWIFQGRTVAELVSMGSTLLDECGLHVAARRLRQLRAMQ